MTTRDRRVGGVVLAAGRSTRMGRPKPLLPVSGRSFLAACVSVLREGGCDPVVVVVGGPAGGDAAGEASGAGAAVAWNRTEGSEQIDSLRIGLEALERLEPEADGALVLPVDHPMVAADTVRTLLAAAAGAEAVMRPAHGGRPGHPTLFPRLVWEALRDPDLPDGARTVLESGDVPVRDVPVDDPGILTDIDTPDAYRRALEAGAP